MIFCVNKKIDKFKIIRKNRFFYWIYKLQKILKNKKPNTHYAEFGEDIFINRIFQNKKKGFYIDIGAYHPFKGSLTKKLYDKGWRGINIDISKISIDLFNISRPKDLNINCAIGAINSDIFYYENSPINQQNSLIKKNDRQKKIQIKSFKLNEVLSNNNIRNVDYINIDTEGTEMDILKSINFSEINPILLTIEDNEIFTNFDLKKEMIQYLKDKKYELINIIGVTLFFFKKDQVHQISEMIKI